ncbi:MAG: zinc ribbon domain-containing protein [Verrucomicrobiales bacterium]|nr:zinc ribbon domain-containing protein [Verrucomicrobiales bacterium]
MPTYQYECDKCGHHFEVFQSMKDNALTTCPKEHCPKSRWGRGKITRQLGTGAGLIFKGSGFYITDYRSEGYKAAAKKDSDAKPSSTPAPSAPSNSSSGSTPAAPKTESASKPPSKPSGSSKTKPSSGS